MVAGRFLEFESPALRIKMPIKAAILLKLYPISSHSSHREHLSGVFTGCPGGNESRLTRGLIVLAATLAFVELDVRRYRSRGNLYASGWYRA